jgi:hypothetical protein
MQPKLQLSRRVYPAAPPRAARPCFLNADNVQLRCVPQRHQLSNRHEGGQAANIVRGDAERGLL